MLARDRLGVKPLYYARSATSLVFASELKSVLASGLVDRELDLEAIDAYLTLGFFPAPRHRSSRRPKLLPGAPARRRRRACRVEPLLGASRCPPRTPAAAPTTSAPSELLELLEEAVRLRLMSDVPLGAMLSGGLDSSLIVALMAAQHDASR